MLKGFAFIGTPPHTHTNGHALWFVKKLRGWLQIFFFVLNYNVKIKMPCWPEFRHTTERDSHTTAAEGSWKIPKHVIRGQSTSSFKTKQDKTTHTHKKTLALLFSKKKSSKNNQPTNPFRPQKNPKKQFGLKTTKNKIGLLLCEGKIKMRKQKHFFCWVAW